MSVFRCKNQSKFFGVQDQSTSNPCTPAQWAALEALEGNQDSVENMRSEYEKRRDYIYKRLNSIKGIRCNLPCSYWQSIIFQPLKNK